MIWKAIILVIVAIIAFLWWRISSVGRGVNAVDAKTLERIAPLEQKLKNGENISEDEIIRLAEQPENRKMLYSMLKEHNKLYLFPRQFLSTKAQAQADMVRWLSHPNELQKPPDELELLEIVEYEINGETQEFYVFKYKTNPPHWAAKDGWMIGASGPYGPTKEDYSFTEGTFSNFNSIDKESPHELVAWIRKNILGQ